MSKSPMNQKDTLQELAELDPAKSYRLVVWDELELYDIMEGRIDSLKSRVQECSNNIVSSFSFRIETISG